MTAFGRKKHRICSVPHSWGESCMTERVEYVNGANVFVIDVIHPMDIQN